VSATRRFTEELLPLLHGSSSDLVLELWVGSGQCGKVEAQVAEQQKPATTSQAAGNQNEFVTLAEHARRLGIRPHVLTPSCAQYARIARAGHDDIAVMLELIASLTRDQLLALVRAGARAPIVAYGGALHNDAAPRRGREAWSFGPDLAKRLGDGYVELDLIVPEYVKDTDVWRSLPWYPHYDMARHGERAALFRTAPGAYALILPRTGT
jgi:hypothetical protein